MDKSPILLFCILAACSVWSVHGRSLEINVDGEEPVEVEVSVEAQAKLPGLCWACEWAVKKVKKAMTKNDTCEKVKARLNSICNNIGFLKKLCQKFVKAHLQVLIEELSTTDDVRTICVEAKACKPKEPADLVSSPSNEEAQADHPLWQGSPSNRSFRIRY